MEGGFMRTSALSTAGGITLCHRLPAPHALTQFQRKAEQALLVPQGQMGKRGLSSVLYLDGPGTKLEEFHGSYTVEAEGVEWVDPDRLEERAKTYAGPRKLTLEGAAGGGLGFRQLMRAGPAAMEE
ncbi:hypothetical protein DL764_007467 [Monosporascus ibericus]|uniref:Uncharacterized protein n=1 Tax=Monosporascus ibericus TaxID=155417 RepID=A0A4Q4T2I6_9PEZI|nr:hypothetical protein DL764_007467 [Monosporascus ibericus]